MARRQWLWLVGGGLLIALSLVDLVFFAVLLWAFANFTADDEFRFEFDGVVLGVSVWYVALKSTQDLLAMVAGAVLIKQGWRAPRRALEQAAKSNIAAKSIGPEPE